MLLFLSLTYLSVETVSRNLIVQPINDGNRDLRNKVNRLAEKVQFNAAPAEKVYFISQGNSGYESLAFRYSVAPLRSQFWCWSIGNRYHENDVWTCDSDLFDLIKGYDFLVLGTADEPFWRENKKYFNEADHGLKAGVFRVVWTPKNTLTFVRMPRYQSKPILKSDLISPQSNTN